MAGKLDLDPGVVRRARALAATAGQPVVDLARSHTTVSVERAVLRLAGVRGADPDGIPWVNRLVDAVRADVGLGHGVAAPVFHAMRAQGIDDVTVLAQKAAAGAVRFAVPQAKGEVTAARRAAATSARDSGTANRTAPAAAFCASTVTSSTPCVRIAWNTGAATPCPSPTSARTASTSRFTQGMPSESAPRTPASRSTARSTDTVVCERARSTTGCPALAASARARRTVPASSSSFPTTTPLLPPRPADLGLVVACSGRMSVLWGTTSPRSARRAGVHVS